MNKIAIITPVFPPYGGGIGRVAAEDARILSSAGFDVEIFSPVTKLDGRQFSLPDNDFEINFLRPFLKFGNSAFIPQLLWKLRKFDAAHLHYPFFGGAEIVWLAKKLGFFKGKLAITYHMDVVGSGWLGKIFSFHTKFLMPRIISSADRVEITSMDYAEHSNISAIIKKYPAKFEAIPIGVDDEFFHPTEKDGELLEKFGIQRDEKIILFVGGLDSAHYFKGLEYLLNAARKIKNNFKIIIAGSGNLKEDYEKMAESLGIKNKVIFTGSPLREDLPRFYNLADVFVLPSIDKSEAFGIVLLEAMASGVPVVASNLYGVRTLVKEGENGFLAESKNAENLAEKIDLILGNEELRKKMKENGRKIVEENYSYKKVGEKLIKFYSNVVLAQAGIQKTKICLINNLYGENARGGAEKVVETIANGLKEKDHEVFIISSKPLVTKMDGRPFSLPNNPVDNPVREYKIFPFNICWYGNLVKHGILFRLFWHAFDIFSLHSFFVIRKILKKENPNIVWTHNLKGLGFLIPLAIKFSKIKHIHALHDTQLSVPSGLLIKGRENDLENTIFLRRWYERICRMLFGSPDIVISPSKWLLSFYAEKRFFPKSEKIVLQNPISVIPAKAGIHEIIDSPNKSGNDNVLNILYLGQVEEHKGIIFAVNALKKLSENFVFRVVGDGEKLEEIKRMAENDNRFIVYGRKSGDELEKIWEKINLTIVPSLCYENSPTVVFESLMRNIPVLASNIGGIPEIVPQEFLFEAGDEIDLTQKIKWFLKNKNQLPYIKFAGMNVRDYIKKILML